MYRIRLSFKPTYGYTILIIVHIMVSLFVGKVTKWHVRVTELAIRDFGIKVDFFSLYSEGATRTDVTMREDNVTQEREICLFHLHS